MASHVCTSMIEQFTETGRWKTRTRADADTDADTDTDTDAVMMRYIYFSHVARGSSMAIL